jgi:hypothetical protein
MKNKDGPCEGRVQTYFTLRASLLVTSFKYEMERRGMMWRAENNPSLQPIIWEDKTESCGGGETIVELKEGQR